jgi:hypothetical protein
MNLPDADSQLLRVSGSFVGKFAGWHLRMRRGKSRFATFDKKNVDTTLLLWMPSLIPHFSDENDK